jgi:hypothetical protein
MPFVRLFAVLYVIQATANDGQQHNDIHPREFVAMEVLPTKNALGESPIWSDRDQALYWVS